MDETQTSFIWSLDQIRAAGRLGAKGFVDKHVIATAPPGLAMDETKKRIWEIVNHMAHPLGLEIDPGDMEFAEIEDPSGFLIKVSGRWNPSTGEIEFRGGAHDGEVLRMPRAGDPFHPIRFAIPLDLGRIGPEDSFPVSASLPTLNYWLTGWSERDRRWIYQQR